MPPTPDQEGTLMATIADPPARTRELSREWWEALTETVVAALAARRAEPAARS